MLKKKSTSFPKIAIVAHRHLGDAILIEPVIRVLKQSNLDVTLLVKSEGAKKIANLFFYPPKTLVFVSLKDLKKLLLKLKVDVVYHFDRSLGTVWASFNANIPWRFGIGTEGRWLFLSQILFKKKKNIIATNTDGFLNSLLKNCRTATTSNKLYQIGQI